MLEKDYPRVTNSETVPGLYIELKDYVNTLDYLGYDMAVELDKVLTTYGLNTVNKCTDKMPIIIQSFEQEGLLKYKELSDLPLVILYSYSSPLTNWKFFGDNFHGIGPDGQWVMNHNSLVFGPTDWVKHWARDTYSPFVKKMHELGLAVHPYTLRDDVLVFRDNAFEETLLYVNNGVDGAFTEFAHSSFELYEGFGSKSGFPTTNGPEDLDTEFEWLQF